MIRLGSQSFLLIHLLREMAARVVAMKRHPRRISAIVSAGVEQMGVEYRD